MCNNLRSLKSEVVRLSGFRQPGIHEILEGTLFPCLSVGGNGVYECKAGNPECRDSDTYSSHYANRSGNLMGFQVFAHCEQLPHFAERGH